MALPSPDDYNDWRDYARVLVAAINEADPTAGGSVSLVQYNQSLPDSQIPAVPAGWRPVWWRTSDAELYLGNPAFDPPTAGALFNIDTTNLALAAVGEDQIKDLAIGTAKIKNAAIVSALIGDAQIVTAKIADLAVNNAKIANLAVTSAKIALLAVGNAQIQDAAITRAKVLDGEITNLKIANIIESLSYNGTNGWRIDKEGLISGTGIRILNPDGSVAFASGSKINLATQVVGFLDKANTTGFGALAALDILSKANISTYIEGAAITNALIANAAIKTANIDVAAITTALIADAAVGRAKIALAAIGTAQIDDAAITNAKIGFAAIKSAQIDDLAVTTLKINGLAVTTDKIDNNAVTHWAAMSGASGELSDNSAGEPVTPGATIFAEGGLLRVDVSFDYRATNGTGARFIAVLRKNGQDYSRQINVNQINNTTQRAPLSFWVTVPEASGYQTFDLRFAQVAGSNGVLTWDNAQIFVQEFKK